MRRVYHRPVRLPNPDIDDVAVGKIVGAQYGADPARMRFEPVGGDGR